MNIASVCLHLFKYVYISFVYIINNSHSSLTPQLYSCCSRNWRSWDTRLWCHDNHCSSSCQSTIEWRGTWDQFSFLGNRARYEFIKLDMSTVLGLSIPSSRPLTFPGEQSKNSYLARFFKRRKKERNLEIKAIMTTWSTKSKTPSRSQFLTDKKHYVAGRLKLFWRRVFQKKYFVF